MQLCGTRRSSELRRTTACSIRGRLSDSKETRQCWCALSPTCNLNSSTSVERILRIRSVVMLIPLPRARATSISQRPVHLVVAASKRRRRRRECERKQILTETQARAIADRLNRKEVHQVHPYKCPFGDH